MSNSTQRHGSVSIDRAREILRGREAPLPEVKQLIKDLKSENAFGYARKLLARVRADPALRRDAIVRLYLGQQHALCTYKDRDLSAARGLREALSILQEVEDLDRTSNQETLGLAGAIYKRKWELDLQKGHLERSLAFYLRGYRVGLGGDLGYTAINAAYLLDLLATIEVRDRPVDAGTEAISHQRSDEAHRIRQEIASTLTDPTRQEQYRESLSQWWFHATLAEAYFGLQKYPEALAALIRGRSEAPPKSWEEESTLRQLASLARLQAERTGQEIEAALEGSEAWKTLREFMGGHESGVRTAFAGKVGLALSGGGFRASLFHLGVLAQLAEMDMLRHVEVLSCVSGGSIVGAHYYLEVRHLLQTKADSEITREDFIEIVQTVARDFLAGVQRNIRTRVAASLVANVKMIVAGNFSRSERVGELYERELFSRVQDGGGTTPRWLNELFIEPKEAQRRFNPKYDNFSRRVKVPILVLNATALNTGHNWQFTASWMGEPPQSGSASSDIDANERLRRLYYEDAPPAHQRVRLGHAVAASACVPGLFDPLVLADLYPDRTVRLVDGGVNDNQGTASLLEADCTVLLISDASGQMSAEPHPSSGLIGVPLRTNGILMARVREAEYNELDSRLQAGLLRGLMFLHLKKDLEAPPLSWNQCEDPDEPRPTTGSPDDLTRYGILKSVQALLSGIRTDLDSFSDVEAFALMTSGYRMTQHEYRKTIQLFPTPTASEVDWPFLAVEGPMKSVKDLESAHKDLGQLLQVGSQLAFKIWLLERGLRFAAAAVGLVVAVVLGWLIIQHWSDPLFVLRPSQFGIAILVFIGGLVLGKKLMKFIRYRDTLERLAVGLSMSCAGFLLARLHLCVFDPWFLRRGSVSRFQRSRVKF